MTVDALSLTFAALADPTRRAILKRLSAGTANVKELSRPFNMSGPAVCKHLRVLERAGLIRRGRDAQSRPCQLETGPLKLVDTWAEPYRALWDASFERLGVYVEELHAQRRKEVRDARRRKR